MQLTDALTDADRQDVTFAATAPEAAHWLHNPTDTSAASPTQAELWEAEPQWEGPADLASILDRLDLL